MLVSGGDTDSFTANVTIGSAAPTIDWVNDSVNASPAEGGTRIIQIQFNVTDNNGFADINTSAAYMNITRPGETTRETTGGDCYSTFNASNIQVIECNITISWYDEEGEWVIAVYIADNQGNFSTNDTSNFTMDTLDAVAVIEDALTFSGTPGQSDQAAQENPLNINNTGNQNYTKINITAYNLTGVAESDTIGASAFAVNVSGGVAGAGQSLVHSTTVLITDAALDRGATATEELYFWVDIPSGIEDDEYSAGTNWEIDPTV